MLRTQLSVRVHGIMGNAPLKETEKIRLSLSLSNTSIACYVIAYNVVFSFGKKKTQSADKLLHSEGRELRRALFSLKQIFQVRFIFSVCGVPEPSSRLVVLLGKEEKNRKTA